MLSDADWAIAPLAFSGGDRATAGANGGGSQSVSPPFPEPIYQAGELDQYEETKEHGTYDQETEDQGFLPPPPPMVFESAGQGYASSSQPEPQRLGYLPYYYDYMFLTGQYPPGTYTHASRSYEQGRDRWQDVHYVRDYPSVAEQPETITDAAAAQQSFDASKQPLGQSMASYRPSSAQPLPSGPSYGNPMQAPSYSQGGYNMGKVHIKSANDMYSGNFI